MELKKLGQLYKGQNGAIYDPSGISPTLRSGETSNPNHGGIGSSNSPKIALNVFTQTNGTNMQTQYTENTLENAMTETSQQYQPQTSQTTTYSLEDFHVRLSAWLEKGEDLKILEELCSLRLLESPSKSNHAFYCLRMSKDYYHTTKGEPLEPSSGRLMNWGMTASGKCLTAKILVSPKTESECSLSDILEEHVDQKYFLSPELTAKLLESLPEGKVKA